MRGDEWSAARGARSADSQSVEPRAARAVCVRAAVVLATRERVSRRVDLIKVVGVIRLEVDDARRRERTVRAGERRHGARPRVLIVARVERDCEARGAIRVERRRVPAI